MKSFHKVWFAVLVAFIAPLSHAQTFELLHFFQYSDGNSPAGELIQGNDGNFYGTTTGGGSANNYGTVFKIMPAGALTKLISFNSNSNGASPYGKLARGNDDNFYGTTFFGGTNDSGTIFKITTNGALTKLVTFNISNGSGPIGGLLLGSDGNFYGTTTGGGPSRIGTVFKMTPGGALTTLVTFNYTNGATPYAGLAEGNDGNFYGTTYDRGPNGRGTVYKMTTNGVLNTLISFDGTNGGNPSAALVLAKDGNFYGTTDQGGTKNIGTVFRMTPSGVLTTLVSFNYTNGVYPGVGLLVQGRDGDFYGTTSHGGINATTSNLRYGTVFKMAPNGTLTTLVSLNNNNGQNPQAGIVQGEDGNFYGTAAGGTNVYGSVFRILMPFLSSKRSEDNLILSWGTNIVGFTLQSSPDINSLTNWIDFTNSPLIVGGQYTVTNLIFGNRQFFRLRK